MKWSNEVALAYKTISVIVIQVKRKVRYNQYLDFIT